MLVWAGTLHVVRTKLARDQDSFDVPRSLPLLHKFDVYRVARTILLSLLNKLYKEQTNKLKVIDEKQQ